MSGLRRRPEGENASRDLTSDGQPAARTFGKTRPQKGKLKGTRVWRTISCIPSRAKTMHIRARDHKRNAMQTQTTFTISPVVRDRRNAELPWSRGNRDLKFWPIRRIAYPD